VKLGLVITLVFCATLSSSAQASHLPGVKAPNLKRYVEKNFPACAEIINVENRNYDPTLDYGGGHGGIYESYGIAQATPGTKMVSAGADWRTNPWTQWRWMRSYVLSRFGDKGDCINALAYRRAHGSY